MPNKALMQLQALANNLPPQKNRMLTCRLKMIDSLAHVGLTANPQKEACACVLTLIGVKEKSRMAPYGRGKRVVTKKIYDVDIWANDADAVEETDVQITSICAENTSHQFTMAPAKPGGIGFYLVMISGAQLHKKNSNSVLAPSAASATEPDAGGTFTVDKVDYIQPDCLLGIKRLMRKLWLVEAAQDDVVEPPCTPYTAKKSRRLGNTPTDESIGEINMCDV